MSSLQLTESQVFGVEGSQLVEGCARMGGKDIQLLSGPSFLTDVLSLLRLCPLSL